MIDLLFTYWPVLWLAFGVTVCVFVHLAEGRAHELPRPGSLGVDERRARAETRPRGGSVENVLPRRES